MKFLDTGLGGAFLVVPDPAEDERGLFARTYCEKEFATQGISLRFVQCSTSLNKRKDTLRGMHYQMEPHGEDKLVRCTRGAIYDVIIDLRKNSPTRLKWFSAELTADNRQALFIPRGFAHGFKTLVDACEVFYQISNFFNPEAASGIRWNDPLFAIDWPGGPPILSDRDRSYSDFKP